MAYLWKGWPERVKAGPSAPRAQEILVPGEGWQLVAEGFKSTRGPACNAQGEVFFADTSNNKIHRIGSRRKRERVRRRRGPGPLRHHRRGWQRFSPSRKSPGKLMSYDAAGVGKVVLDDIVGHSILAMPDGGLYVTSNGDKADGPGTVWFIKDGKKTRVDSGVKFATGMTVSPRSMAAVRRRRSLEVGLFLPDQ